MLFEYVSGGELFTYLRDKGRFTIENTRFYICEIVSALAYLKKYSKDKQQKRSIDKQRIKAEGCKVSAYKNGYIYCPWKDLAIQTI